MKNLLILLATLFCVNTCIAQKDYDPARKNSKNNLPNEQVFKISDGKLIWQKVYECKDSINQIVSNLKRGGSLRGIDVTDNVATGSLKDIEVDYKGAGFSRGTLPIYITSHHLSCFVVIDFKKGKYRITIKNIQLTDVPEGSINKFGESEPIETYALKNKNTEFRDLFIKAPATILNYTFNKIFEQTAKEEDDNW